ncbi:putative cytochrome [Zancudomyces culisetae]|uniref:Putative cytochrome n=1 Tax=Zancudomyces culisetae TaxID=1213189 RepID=A0A1R1PI57_ZANCU|nr:putative cytochrome [Zancudomyces culisetae]|eukprot:OMH80593.1 putative cytochrome [Zancudomyces culisetae]
MTFAISFRYFGPHIVKDIELFGSVLDLTEKTSKVIAEETLYTSLYKVGIVGKNHILEYLELETQRRAYLPSYQKPRDIVQYIADNSDTFGMNIQYPLHSLQFVMEMGVAIISTRLHNLIVELSLRPQVYDELGEEQRLSMEKYLDNGSLIPFEALDEMVLLDAFIKETIRLAGSSSFIPRYVCQDFVVSNGVTIPKNSLVSFNIYSHNRDTSIFGKNASEFDYKRHIRLGLKLTDTDSSNVMWSAGTEVCAAKLYSIYIIKLILSLIIRNYYIRSHCPIASHLDSNKTSHYSTNTDLSRNSGLYFVSRN